MNGQALGSSPRRLSAQHLDLFIKQAAERFSQIRRVRTLFWEHQRKLNSIHDMHSTYHEMNDDWENACTLVALQILEGAEIDLTQIDPLSYRILEGVWLRHVKQLRAYYIWEAEDRGSNEANYYQASNEIRKLLRERETSEVRDFERVRNYIQERYLVDGNPGSLDDTKPATKMLISAKAERIYRTLGDTDAAANWFRARLYTSLFYESIIGAVDFSDKAKTISILKAFQFSKSPKNKYWIINAFEAAISIHFLNKGIVKEILEKPAMYNFSMEPVECWPGEVAMPESLFYDKDNKQLMCLGYMKDVEKQALLKVLTKSDHRLTLENLYQQSRLGPLEEMIL
jgi:hypothetical protein